MTNKIKYQHRQTTDLGAKMILKKLQHHPICVVNVDTGGGKTFMAIRAVGVYRPHAHLVVFTTRKQVDAHNWQDSINAYNQAVKKSELTYQVINYEALNFKKGKEEFLTAWL